MSQLVDIVDLSTLGLKPGGGKHLDLRVKIGDFVFSGETYELADDPVEVSLDVSRSSSGNVIRVRLTDSLLGPCMRCHGDYELPVVIDHSEVHEPVVDPEMASDYVDGHDLDLAALVRDAIGLALPPAISSPVDEDGICTQCTGAAERLGTLHDAPAAEDELEAQPDPRWAKLRELEFEDASTGEQSEAD